MAKQKKRSGALDRNTAAPSPCKLSQQHAGGVDLNVPVGLSLT